VERFSPKPLAKALRLLRRRSRQLARTQKGSKNHAKASVRLAHLHRRVRNVRRDFLHKLTTWLASPSPVLVVEDLNVRGDKQSSGLFVRERSGGPFSGGQRHGRGRLSRSVADAGWGTFRRMLAYKAAWYGSRLVEAPRFYPSTKTCSACGALRERMVRASRVFRCAACGLELDRDLNAARNLRAYGLAHLTGPTGEKQPTGRERGHRPLSPPPGRRRSPPETFSCGDPSGGGTALGRSTRCTGPVDQCTGRGSRKWPVIRFASQGEMDDDAPRNGSFALS